MTKSTDVTWLGQAAVFVSDVATLCCHSTNPILVWRAIILITERHSRGILKNDFEIFVSFLVTPPV